jgi:hypothetical protein
MSILEEVDESRKNIGREAYSCEEALQVADVASPTKQGSRSKKCWSDSKGNTRHLCMLI